MAKQDYQGPYLGFWFNGHHSSEFNIVRVSTNNRYSEDMSPDIKDIIVERPGGDGSYYFGSTYQSKNFTVNFAFDSMTEEEYQQYNIWVNNKKPAKFSFDEWNETWDKVTKYYMAKISSNATLKFVCFDEHGQRVYKGEGSLTFNCQFPFAIKEKTQTAQKHVINIDKGQSSPVIIAFDQTENLRSFYVKDRETILASVNLLDENISLAVGQWTINSRAGTVFGLDEITGQSTDLSRYLTTAAAFDVTNGSEIEVYDLQNKKTLESTLTYYNYE